MECEGALASKSAPKGVSGMDRFSLSHVPALSSLRWRSPECRLPEDPRGKVLARGGRDEVRVRALPDPLLDL